jgi:folate-binding protein YgfZ
LDAPSPALPALSADAWAWLEVTSGIARIVDATVERFVPQMVNFELVGGVNFQKGCYPGQEVVARSQYRGIVKRRAFVFEADAAAQPGQEVFHSGDAEQPAGMVINAASLAGAHRALVEVKLAALDAGSLHLGAAGGPLLQRIALQPYAVPIEAAA